MAHFRKIDDKWRAEVQRNGRRVSKRFHTKREAELWAAKQEADITAAQDKPTSTHTVADGVRKYLLDVTARKASRRNESSRMEAFVRDFPVLAGKRLCDVSTADLAQWRDARLSNIKGSSFLREATPLRHMFKLAGREWGWCSKDSPFDGLALPDDTPARTRRISLREVRRILRAFGFVTRQAPASLTQEVGWVFLVSLHTALRSSEVLRLTRQSVDLRHRVITLASHKTVKKTGAREVPFTRAAGRALAVLVRAAEAQGRDELFTVTDASRDALFRKHLGLLGLQGIHFHDARATALTRLSRRVDVLKLARISGHQDLKILLRTYYRASAAEIAAEL